MVTQHESTHSDAWLGWRGPVAGRWVVVTAALAGIVGGVSFVTGGLPLEEGVPVLVTSALFVVGLLGVWLRALQLEGAARNLHALHLTHLERWEQAGDVLDEALRYLLLDRATRANVLLNRAIVFIRQGEPDQGLALLQELDQQRPRALLEMALAQALMGELGAARATMQGLEGRLQEVSEVDLELLVHALLQARERGGGLLLSDVQAMRVSESQFMRRTMRILEDFQADTAGQVVRMKSWKVAHARRLGWLGASWPEMAAFLNAVQERGEALDGSA